MAIKTTPKKEYEAAREELESRNESFGGAYFIVKRLVKVAPNLTMGLFSAFNPFASSKLVDKKDLIEKHMLDEETLNLFVEKGILEEAGSAITSYKLTYDGKALAIAYYAIADELNSAGRTVLK